jgi:hypothetical protein
VKHENNQHNKNQDIFTEENKEEQKHLKDQDYNKENTAGTTL